MEKGYTEKEIKIAAKSLNLKFGFAEYFINKLRENRNKYVKVEDNIKRTSNQKH